MLFCFKQSIYKKIESLSYLWTPLNIDPVPDLFYFVFSKLYTRKSGSLSYLWTPLNIDPVPALWYFVLNKIYTRKSGYPAKKIIQSLFLCKSSLIMLICNIFGSEKRGRDPTRGLKKLTLLHVGLCVAFWVMDSYCLVTPNIGNHYIPWKTNLVLLISFYITSIETLDQKLACLTTEQLRRWSEIFYLNITSPRAPA